MKLKPLLCILALLVALICILPVAAGWAPEEMAMLKTLERSEQNTQAAIATDAREVTTNHIADPPEQSIPTPTPATVQVKTSRVASDTSASCDHINTSQTSQSSKAQSSPDDSTLGVAPNELILFQVSQYRPREEVHLAHPSNFGDRYTSDVYGRPVANEFIVVLHETVYSASSAVNFFQTPHPKDTDQASYHTLIQRDGTVV